MRYRWSSTGNDALIRMKQALEDALVSDKRMSLKAIAQQLGCTTAILYKRFPDLSQAVIRVLDTPYSYHDSTHCL